MSPCCKNSNELIIHLPNLGTGFLKALIDVLWSSLDLPKLKALIYFIVDDDNISNIMVATTSLFLSHQSHIPPVIIPWQSTR